jgi:hypothetical protein
MTPETLSREDMLRQEALRQAVVFHTGNADAIVTKATAEKFFEFLTNSGRYKKTK